MIATLLIGYCVPSSEYAHVQKDSIKQAQENVQEPEMKPG